MAIRDMIVELEIAPGTRLVENDLAARLNVSKTPIREAIALLEADGLIDIAPYRGATVRWLSLDEMEEQRFLIDAIELPAFPLVIERIDKETLTDLAKVVRQMKRARAKNDGPTFRRLTSATHATLFRPVGYPRLDRFITILIGPVGPALRPGLRGQLRRTPSTSCWSSRSVASSTSGKATPRVRPSMSASTATRSAS